MSYLVLARRYRPQTFEEIAGQEHVTGVLSQALQADRIAHAYLFCGPRGVGKTSCARILAKSLNCEKGPTLKPCGECAACREIAQGTSFDVIEIDGASNRGIDEIRAVRENVKFAPGYGRFKIYIVDEVHMLTAEAFNALLKTLEEPPEHVKFIFATTAPNKVPATIISRCQRFDFKRIPIKVISECLKDIVKQEKLKVDDDAIYAVSKSAQGSLRDALGILDQVSGLAEKNVTADDVCAMLGLVDTDLLFELVDALGRGEPAAALMVLDKVLDKGKDIKQLLRDMTEHFRHMMVIKVGGKSMGRLVDYPVAIKEIILTQCEAFTLPAILTAIDTLINVHDAARITENVRLPLETALVRLAGVASGLSVENEEARADQVNAAPKGQEKKFSAMGALRNKKGEVSLSRLTDKNNGQTSEPKGADPRPAVASVQKEAPDTREQPAAMTSDPVLSGPLDLQRIQKAWDVLTYAVSRKKMSLATYLQEGGPVKYKDQALTIGFAKEFKFHMERVKDQSNIKLIEEIFSEKLNARIQVSFELVEEPAAMDEDEDLKRVLETFKGAVVSKWHND